MVSIGIFWHIFLHFYALPTEEVHIQLGKHRKWDRKRIFLGKHIQDYQGSAYREVHTVAVSGEVHNFWGSTYGEAHSVADGGEAHMGKCRYRSHQAHNCPGKCIK